MYQLDFEIFPNPIPHSKAILTVPMSELACEFRTVIDPNI